MLQLNQLTEPPNLCVRANSSKAVIFVPGDYAISSANFSPKACAAWTSCLRHCSSADLPTLVCAFTERGEIPARCPALVHVHVQQQQQQSEGSSHYPIFGQRGCPTAPFDVIESVLRPSRWLLECRTVARGCKWVRRGILDRAEAVQCLYNWWCKDDFL